MKTSDTPKLRDSSKVSKSWKTTIEGLSMIEGKKKRKRHGWLNSVSDSGKKKKDVNGKTSKMWMKSEA